MWTHFKSASFVFTAPVYHKIFLFFQKIIKFKQTLINRKNFIHNFCFIFYMQGYIIFVEMFFTICYNYSVKLSLF